MLEIAQKFFIAKMAVTAQRYQYAGKTIHVHILKNASKIVESAIEN